MRIAEEDYLDWTAERAVTIDRLIRNNPRGFGLAVMRTLVQAAYDRDRQTAAM
ncbi:hypothetical protein [Pseudohoeflea suaedae]|uniref:hypothetical protein n=1 Tax=Pseudohoeflea suaedae TaxID=877384 RepID=UPI00187E7402|nr:hypothetical protein [Pseudohoeflea suaedae]